MVSAVENFTVSIFWLNLVAVLLLLISGGTMLVIYDENQNSEALQEEARSKRATARTLLWTALGLGIFEILLGFYWMSIGNRRNDDNMRQSYPEKYARPSLELPQMSRSNPSVGALV